MYSTFAGFGTLHASTEVASTLFYNLPSLHFTSSLFFQLNFSPLLQTLTLTLPPPYQNTAILNIVSVPPYVLFLSLHPQASAVALVRRTCTGTSRCCRVVRNFWRRKKTLLPLAGGPDPCSPTTLKPPHISLPPMLPHQSPPPQATLHLCPYLFCRSNIHPPQNRHHPGRLPN